MQRRFTEIPTRILLFVLAALVMDTDSAALAVDNAAKKRAIDSGAQYLRSVQESVAGGRDSLCAYAILKAGGSATEPGNAKLLARIVERCQGDKYNAHASHESIYAAGIEAMILADVDPEKYKPQLQKIAAFLIEAQLENGGFDYRGKDAIGDTSVLQYGALGLWAASRANVDVPPVTWDKIALWHLRGQADDGGFAYVPGRSEGPTRGDSNASMSAAAAASMTICAMYLHPQRMHEVSGLTGGLHSAKPRLAQVDPNDPLGVLTRRQGGDDPAKPPPPEYRPKASFDALQNGVARAQGFVASRFTTQYQDGGWRMYYFYTIERMGALVDIERLGDHDWYDEIATELIRTQKPDGSWDMPSFEVGMNKCVSTSFAVLFLTRSTAKLLNRTPPADPIGGGMQAGGRGLPDDLTSVTMRDGRVEQAESLGPLDDLLKSLESGASDDLFNLQTQIVKKIQLGDRSELIGQTDRLVKLLDYPGPDVRRTALWALARSDDLSIARHMVRALQDPGRDVLIEAHNALCWLSRRPNAFDIPPDPIGDLPPDATDEQKQQAVETWRANALKHWGTWYLKMCSYEERNTPFAHDLAKQIGLK